MTPRSSYEAARSLDSVRRRAGETLGVIAQRLASARRRTDDIVVPRAQRLVEQARAREFPSRTREFGRGVLRGGARAGFGVGARREPFDTATILVGVGIGAAAGAGLMYLLDPGVGRRRRAALRQRTGKAGRRAAERAERRGTDLANRASGTAHGARRWFRRATPDDDKLEARVRSRLGHVVDRPGAITVHAHAGVITLEGDAPRAEVRRLLAEVRRVAGVTRVENRLDFRDNPASRLGEGREPREDLNPAQRAGLGAAGAALVGWGLARRDPVGGLLALVGGGLLAGALLTRRPLEALAKVRPRRGIYVEHGVDVDAPVDEVFRFWNSVENWPEFMPHLKEVRVRDDGRHSHWVAAAPLGLSASWDAELTVRRENELIGWRSLPGSIVDTAGTVRFEPVGDRRTRVTVRMTYGPPAGRLGHMIASIFGDDPQQALEDDLDRAKNVLERRRGAGREALRSSPPELRGPAEIAGM